MHTDGSVLILVLRRSSFDNSSSCDLALCQSLLIPRVALAPHCFQILQAFYSLSMLFSVLLMVFVAMHCPLGIACMVVTCLLLASIYFVIGGLLTFALIVGSDGCPNLEQIAVYVGGNQHYPIIK